MCKSSNGARVDRPWEHQKDERIVMRRLLFSLSLLAVVSTGFAQRGALDPAKAVELRAIETRLDQLQREIDRNREETDHRVASEFAAINTRFDDSKDSTRWALGLLTLLA